MVPHAFVLSTAGGLNFLSSVVYYCMAVAPKLQQGNGEPCKSLRVRDKGSNAIHRIALLPGPKQLSLNSPLAE